MAVATGVRLTPSTSLFSRRVTLQTTSHPLCGNKEGQGRRASCFPWRKERRDLDDLAGEREKGSVDRLVQPGFSLLLLFSSYSSLKAASMYHSFTTSATSLFQFPESGPFISLVFLVPFFPPYLLPSLRAG